MARLRYDPNRQIDIEAGGEEEAAVSLIDFPSQTTMYHNFNFHPPVGGHSVRVSQGQSPHDP